MQYPLNIQAPSRLSAAITTNTNTAINTGGGAQVTGYVCTDAGSSWTFQLFNGDPSNGGVAVGPAITPSVGINSLPNIGFPNGLYVQTAGTTAGSIQIAYH